MYCILLNTKISLLKIFRVKWWELKIAGGERVWLTELKKFSGDLRDCKGR